MLNFSSYATFSKIINVRMELLNDGGFEYRVALAAGMVGPLSSLISTPFELVKIQMQLNRIATGASNTVYKNSLHAAYDIVTRHGIQRLYTGHAVNTLREIVFLSTYFTTYEHIKTKLLSFIQSHSLSVPIAGGISGAFGWFVSFPLDAIKGNIQGRQLDSSTAQKSSYEIAKLLMQQKGIRGLYSGLLPSVTRAFLVSSTRFSAYEATLWLLQQEKL
jgi:solute carrier family 25 carnitine/acylcarnitine transporter 20/29